MTVESKQFVCEVILPEISPVHNAIGRPSSRRAVARRSAAFEACILLRKAGYLDENLLPTYHKQLPAMRNAHLALNMKMTNSYDMLVKPRLWEISRGIIPVALYLTIIELETPENLGWPSQPLAMLTRTPLPDFPTFPLYFENSNTSHIRCTSLRMSMKLSETALKKLTNFTLRMFLDIFNKEYEFNQEQMSYWLAPILYANIGKDYGSPELLVDWMAIDFVDAEEDLRWSEKVSDNELINRYLVDRWDGSKRFYSVAIQHTMRPDDPVPDDAAPAKYMDNILNYTVSLFAKSRVKATWKKEQPVLLAHKIMHRRNYLDKFDMKDVDVKTRAYVCPEPLKISAV